MIRRRPRFGALLLAIKNREVEKRLPRDPEPKPSQCEEARIAMAMAEKNIRSPLALYKN